MKKFVEMIKEATESGSSLAQDLKDLIAGIIEMESEGVEGQEGPVDIGLEILSEVADQLSDDAIAAIMEQLSDYFDLDALEQVEDEEDYDGDMDESLSREDEILAEMQTAKQHKLSQIKAKKKAALGDKANTLQFKRNFFFDTKTKKFVKRDKALSIATLKAKARAFKKILKKASTKKAAMKTKKKFGEA